MIQETKREVDHLRAKQVELGERYTDRIVDPRNIDAVLAALTTARENLEAEVDGMESFNATLKEIARGLAVVRDIVGTASQVLG